MRVWERGGRRFRAWRTEPAFRGREPWLRAAVAAAEDGLVHPVAVALRDACPVMRDKLPVPGGPMSPDACHPMRDQGPRIAQRRIEPGLGVVASVVDEGGQPVEIRVGEWELGELAAGGPRTAFGDGAGGKEVFVFVGGAPAATIELVESWREGLETALAELRALGVEVEILTGDPAATGAGFGGAAVRAGLVPADKLARVQSLTAAGRCVVFLGDGVNDAAAMSAAPASVAMQAGADLARAAAMAVYAGADLRFLPRAIRLARRVRRSIRANLGFAAAYNGIGMALAAVGVLHPVVAALLMVGSSAFVSVNALRGAATEAGAP